MPDLAFETAAGGLVAGVDEAGRGPWAGPVVAAAVILHVDRLNQTLLNDLDDSKVLSKKKREALYDALPGAATIAVGAASAREIDQINILQATFLAMGRALDGLSPLPDHVLVDGNRLPPLSIPAQAIVGGDGKSLSIAAASIIAKVTRDKIMADLDLRYPGFGWGTNAGYGTQAHKEGLRRFGATPHHRMSFKPIKILREIKSSP